MHLEKTLATALKQVQSQHTAGTLNSYEIIMYNNEQGFVGSFSFCIFLCLSVCNFCHDKANKYLQLTSKSYPILKVWPDDNLSNDIFTTSYYATSTALSN